MQKLIENIRRNCRKEEIRQAFCGNDLISYYEPDINMDEYLATPKNSQMQIVFSKHDKKDFDKIIRMQRRFEDSKIIEYNH